MVHVLNDAAKPRHVLEDWLVGEGLLNPIVAGVVKGLQGWCAYLSR